VRRQLETAGRTIEETGVRTRAMERKLRSVEELPAGASTEMLDLGDSAGALERDELPPQASGNKGDSPPAPDVSR